MEWRGSSQPKILWGRWAYIVLHSISISAPRGPGPATKTPRLYVLEWGRYGTNEPFFTFCYLTPESVGVSKENFLFE